jgi:hypothetical protein
MEYKRLTNSITGLFNFVNKKINSTEISDYVLKLKMVSNHGSTSDLDIIVNGIIEFSHKNRELIKARTLDGLVHEKFDVMQHINKHRHLFSEEEISNIWKRVHEIINISIVLAAL